MILVPLPRAGAEKGRAAVLVISLGFFPEKSRQCKVKKQSEKGRKESTFFLEWLQFDNGLGGRPSILQRHWCFCWHIFRGFSLPLPLTSFFFTPPPRPRRLSCPVLAWTPVNSGI